jgi:hypothetical protein
VVLAMCRIAPFAPSAALRRLGLPALMEGAAPPAARRLRAHGGGASGVEGAAFEAR